MHICPLFMSQIHQQNRNIRRGNARNAGCLADVDRAVQVQLLFRLDAQALDLVVIDVLRDFLLFHLLEPVSYTHLDVYKRQESILLIVSPDIGIIVSCCFRKAPRLSVDLERTRCYIIF